MPADASRTTFCVGSTAARRASASNVADIVLAAYRAVAAEAAEEDIFGCRRKFPAVDALDGVDESLLRVGQYLRAVGPGREQWRHALGPAERDIRGFAERPVAAGVRLEALLGTASAMNRSLDLETVLDVLLEKGGSIGEITVDQEG